MLNLQITLIVPSKTKDGERLSLARNKQECLTVMGNIFGGATSSTVQDGCYVMECGKMMYEQNVSITSYTKFDTNLTPFFDFVLEVKEKYNQECIAVIINNEMKFF
jgi:hypothetical protein